MRLTLEPFIEQHLDGAAELLAARHRADRGRAPQLPARFEDAGEARRLVEAALHEHGALGVAAFAGGRMAGYLIGAVTLPWPGSLLATYVRPRSVTVDLPGHATDPEAGPDTYRALYAALAPRWLAAGCFSHYVHLPAGDRDACDAWFSLGFGQESVYGVRSTEFRVQSSGFRAAAGADLIRGTGKEDIRRAGPDDLDTVVGLVEGLERYESGAAIFRPFLPEREQERRAEHAPALADPAKWYWLVYRAGRAVGLHVFGPSPADAMHFPERCIHLDIGYTEPAARGTGPGTALLARGLAEARAAGCAWCVVDWVAPNLLGSSFWLGSGFRPVSTWLVRHLDERIGWAGGRGQHEPG